MKAKVLIVEDQFIEAKSLHLMLSQAGYSTCSIARSVAVALSVIEQEKPDLVLIDIFLQGEQTGIDLAKKLHHRNIAFVYLSASSNRQILEAAKATRPYGFLVKPFRARDVLVMLDVALYLHQYRMQEKSSSTSSAGFPASRLIHESGQVIGNSIVYLKMIEQIERVAPTDTSVLVLGESGSGKEVIAQAIHRISNRSQKPFIVVNCATLPPSLIESELFGHEKGSFTGATARRTGKFELANYGTIFLDEIGELPPDLQVKFLRVLQEKEIEPIGGHTKKIDVRIIAATNKNLEEEVAAVRFRIDLYYRLNVFPIAVPPLRERTDDILLLAEHFLKKYSRENGIPVVTLSNEAADTLLRYHWPGNIRELENTIQRNILLAKDAVIHTVALPALKNGSGFLPERSKQAQDDGGKRTGSYCGCARNL